MFECKKSQLLPYPLLYLYSIILDVSSYPQFVPWCDKVKIIENSSDRLIAETTIKFKLFKISYLSSVTFGEDEKSAWVEVNGRSAFFKYFHSRWDLKVITSNADETLVQFYNKFDVNYRLFRASIANAYERAQQEIMGAFESRAKYLLHLKD